MATQRHGRVAFLSPGVSSVVRASKPDSDTRARGKLAWLLRHRRSKLALSREAAAVVMDTSEATLRKWENGRTPLVTAYPWIIKFLGCEPWPEPKTLAERIRAARYRRGLRIEDAAVQLSVDRSTLWWWENGRKPHRHGDRARVAAFVDGQAGIPAEITSTPSDSQPTDTPDIGAKIKARRTDLGLTQRAVASLLGVNEWTVINWENGYNAPSERFYPSLIRFLGQEPWPEPTSIGERLRAERLRRGFSRVQIASVLQVDDGSVAAWEAGRGPRHDFTKAKVEAFLRGRPRPRRAQTRSLKGDR
jgi:transcriptional regulator with XRE-family HTH domain